MALWGDVTTEDGALSATGMGGVACFVYAGLTVLGAFFFNALEPDNARRIYTLSGIGIEVLIFLIAGWRLRIGKGLIWGSIATLLLLLELVAKVMAMMIGGGLVLNVVLLIVTAAGVRGAWALRKGIPDPEADAAIFS